MANVSKSSGQQTTSSPSTKQRIIMTGNNNKTIITLIKDHEVLTAIMAIGTKTITINNANKKFNIIPFPNIDNKFRLFYLLQMQINILVNQI